MSREHNLHMPCFAFLAALLVAQSAQAPSAHQAAKGREIVRTAQLYLQQKSVPGCSIAIAQGGRIVFAEGIGWANTEERRPVKPDTVFRLGSISKSVTAVATMSLVEKGGLKLEDDVRSYVPAFLDKGKTITVEHILSHRSGIRHYNSDAESLIDKHYERAVKALEVFAADPLLHDPGAKFSYSTHAYTLLAAALEASTGRRFPVLVQELVSKPSGARTLRCENIRVQDPARTTLYVLNSTGSPAAARPVDNSWKYAGGGMESTAPDLCRFGSALLRGSILKPESLERMWTVPKFEGAQPYALGWRTLEGPYGRIAAHSGAQQGCQSFLIIYRDKGVVIAILTNRSGHPMGMLLEEIERIWFANTIKEQRTTSNK